MVAPTKKNYSITEIRSRAFLLQPALTSNFEVYIKALSKADEFIKSSGGGVFGGVEERLLIGCSEASLPGSSLATHELNNDVTGITQRHSYRRLYDDRADFTFYVTAGKGKEYEQIKYFERWIMYISGEQEATAEDVTYPYRSAWPEDYKTSIYITKFERDAQAKKGFKNPINGGLTSGQLVYTFFNAFPISISSMPVSYDSSSLLKCTVSFTYDKYVAKKTSATANQGTAFSEPGQSPAKGVPNPNDVSYAGGKVAQNAFTGNASVSGNYFNTAPNQNNRQPTGAGSEAENNQITIQRANEQQIA